MGTIDLALMPLVVRDDLSFRSAEDVESTGGYA
jgi:hypothetical protein